MNYLLSEEDIKFNETLNPISVLNQMGFTENSYYVEDKTIRLFCPIHKDQVRRSLIIDREKNTFKCGYTICSGHKGGRLIELYANYIGINISEVKKHIIEKIFPERELSQIADKLVHSGRLREALPILLKAVETRPNDGIIRCKLASLLLELGEREEGIEQYFKAAEDFGIRGELDKTLSIYNILVILGPENIKVRRQLAYLYTRLGRLDASAEQLKWVVDSLLKKGIVDEAQEACEEIIELAPKEPMAPKTLGNILLRIGMILDGVKHLEKAGYLFLEKGDNGSAMETAKIGMMFQPNNPALIEIVNRAEAGEETVTTKSEEEIQREEEFMNWVGSLEASLSEPQKPGYVRSPTDTSEILPTDARVARFKKDISSLSDEQTESMRQYLVNMFQDVKKTYEDGFLESWEMKIIKEFYKSFCIAIEQHKKEKGI